MVSAEEGARRVLEVTAERDDLLLRSNDYKVSKVNSKQKLSEQNDILKAMTASLKQLEKKLSSVMEEKRLLEKTNKRLMRMYGAQNTVMGRVGKLIKSVSTCFLGMAMCINKAPTKWVLKEISRPEYFSVDLHRNWTRHFGRSSEKGTDIGGGERVAPSNTFLLAAVGAYKRPFTFRSTVVVEFAEAQFESVKSAANFEKDGRKEKVLR